MIRQLAATSLVVCCGFAATAAPVSNAALAEIVAADQADRIAMRAGTGPNDLMARDAQRREQVLALLRGGALRTDDDHHNAALVFQHGETADDARLAHALAITASRINPDNRGARWLAAASWDRLMMRLKRPQWYATQFVRRGDAWVLYEVDASVVSDEERLRVGARTIEQALERAAAMNLR